MIGINVIKKTIFSGMVTIMFLVSCNSSIDEQDNRTLHTIESLYEDINTKESVQSWESSTSAQEKHRELILKALADKEYPNAPEPFYDVLRQYEQIIMVTQGLDWDSAWDEFYYGDWQYVYGELYGAGRYDNIYYSFYDLTGDEFPEMIMGRIFQGQFRPYLIYYYDGDEVWGECTCERYDMALYEDGIVEMVGPTIIFYLQFESNTEKWECVEHLEIRYEGNGILGYVRKDLKNNLQESVFEEVSEEEYRQIIEQYRKTPINLKWTVLWEVVG